MNSGQGLPVGSPNGSPTIEACPLCGVWLIDHETCAERLLAALYSDQGVTPWVICWARGDHVYPTCPHARRSVGGYQIVDDPLNRLDPDGGDVCGWCRRLWVSRGRPEHPFEVVQSCR